MKRICRECQARGKKVILTTFEEIRQHIEEHIEEYLEGNNERGTTEVYKLVSILPLIEE